MAVGRDIALGSRGVSVCSIFGSGLVPPGTGFMLQNRGGLLLARNGAPNMLVPHKRPFHTIIPAFMQKGEDRIGFGIMGGSNKARPMRSSSPTSPITG